MQNGIGFRIMRKWNRGIDEWMEALDIFEQYIETRHYPLVEKGCEALFHASQKMHEVARLGDKTGTELEELAQGRGGPVEEILPSVDDQLEEEPDYTLAPVDQTDYSTLDDRPVG